MLKARAHAALSLHRVSGQFDWGGRPAARVHESVERLATESAPAVRAATGVAVA